MTLSLILQGLLPLVVFAVVDMFAGLRWAIIAAIVFALGEAVWTYTQFGEVDSLTWISLALVVVFGLISLALNKSAFFKFQPVVLGVSIAAVLAYFQFFDEPILVKFLPKMVLLIPEEQREIFSRPEVLHKLVTLSGGLIVVYLIHAAWVAYAALRQSTGAWLLTRGLGIYVLIIPMALAVQLF